MLPPRTRRPARPARARRSPRTRRRSRPGRHSRGATKSARARFGRPGGLTICWRSVWIVPTGRLASRRRTARCRRRRCWPARTRRRRGREEPLARRSGRAAPGHRRGATVPPRRPPGRRGSRGSGPLSSHVAKNGVQSIRSTSVVERLIVEGPDAQERRPRRRRRPVQSIASRWRRASAIGSARSAPRAVAALAADGVVLGADAGGECRPARPRPSGPPATPTARDASCDVDRPGRGTAGSILTAVWVREVVAPPISSGSSKPSRSISPATWRISSSDGVMSPDSPIRSASDLAGGVQDPRRRDHHAEVDRPRSCCRRARRRRCSCRCRGRRP